MNESDRDLILDLTEGRLTGPEAKAARARIAASPALRAELATQQEVRNTLAAAEPARMTIDEQAALSAALREQLNIPEAPAPVPVPVATPRRTRWWAPVLGLATVAAVLVGFVALGPLGGSDDAGTIEVATELGTQETTIAENGSTLGRAEGDLEAVDGGSDEPSEEASPPQVAEESEGAATEPMAAADDADMASTATTAPAAAEADVVYAMDAGGDQAAVPDLADDVPPALELHATLQRSGFSTQAASQDLEDASVGEEIVTRDALIACQAAFSGSKPVGLVRVEPLATGTSDGRTVVILLLEFADLEYFTVTVDLLACQIVDSAPATP